jgi:hypothetical protein
MIRPPKITAARAACAKTLPLLALLLCATPAHAQAKPPAAPTPAPAAKGVCTGDIPFGVKVVRLPDPEQKKVLIADFSISPNKDAVTYDLAMRVKNGSTTWCLTSLAITYVLGDARGQEWTANEYPAVMAFTTHSPSTGDKAKPEDKAKADKAKAAAPHGVGMPPGQEEKRIMFDLYNYIQPRPTGLFDGFHLISAEIKSCMGYPLTKSP